MDLQKNLDRVQAMLIDTCGCTYPEAIMVCEEAALIFKLKEEKLQKRLKKIKANGPNNIHK